MILCALGVLVGLLTGWLIASRAYTRSLRRWQAYADEVTPTLKLLADLPDGAPDAGAEARLRQRAQVALILHPDATPVLLDASPTPAPTPPTPRIIN